jgi:flagellar FliL protein
MHIGYDQNDTAASSELNGRRYELQEFVRRFFSGKYAAELLPEHERRLKQEIIEQLNTRYLDTAKVREIVFVQLNVNPDF